MNTKGFITATAILIASINYAWTQLSIGIKGGVTISDATINGFIPGLTPEAKTLIGGHTGIFALIPIEGKFSFRPEFNFTQKGFSVRENMTANVFGLPLPVGGRAETRLNYIEMPLLLQYRFGNEKAGFYLNGGPSGGFLTSGRIQPFATIIVDVRLPAIELDLSGDSYNRFDFSAVAGAGGDIAIGPGKVMADIRYTHGFTNTLNDPVINTTVRNQGWTFSLGYAYNF